MRHNPLAFSYSIKLSPPSTEDKNDDAGRLRKELEKKGFKNVDIPIHILRRLSEEMRKNNFTVDLVFGVCDNGFKLFEIGKKVIYGIALDIGTSNISCSLFNLDTCERIDSHDTDNPQVTFGSDVLSRVQMSMLGESARLNQLLLEGINDLITTLCRRNNISPREIFAVSVAGNTIMTHFFLGLDVRNISVSPYVPALSGPAILSAEETGLDVHKYAVVFVFPNAGSYVGGDIISGMLYSEIYKEEKPVLFIDVGTNVEITLGCSEWIMVGAGAAGPALEDGIAGIGKRAEKGTISSVKIDPATKEINIDVIDDIEPSGICGSGMIDLVAELFSTNVIDQSGRFTDKEKRIIKKDGEKGYMVFRSDTRQLVLKEREIQNFIRSKAAMFAFLYVFVRSVGMSLKDIGKIYIAGALGCGINLENAIKIGMLPDLPRERFIFLDNSSLGGAELVLCYRNLLTDVETIRTRITYREMGEDTEILNALQGALFIPHTDPEILKG